ncbi:MAG: hemerythrin domain-containing protein [Planctomycetes bacterium]|nr:hemerythrin domain-containing protein [Planctomycetota bacterium]
MRPTELLKEDHKVILRMIAVMKKAADDVIGGGGLNVEHLERMVDFIRTFADKCHHGKEEDLLFVEMERYGIPKEGGPIGVMLEEHIAGRNYVKGMAEGIDEIKAGKKGGNKKFAENARGYASLLTQHIDKEDNILYMMADMHLDRNADEKLLAKFEKVEKKIMGTVKRGEYVSLVETFEKMYLK